MHVEAFPRLADMLCPDQSHPSSSPPARVPSKEFVLLKHPYTKVTKVKLEVNVHQGDTASRQAVSLWGKASYQTYFKSRSWIDHIPQPAVFYRHYGLEKERQEMCFGQARKMKCFKGVKEGTSASVHGKGMMVFDSTEVVCGRKCQHGCAEWQRKAERCHRLSKWDSSYTTVAPWLCKHTTKASETMPWMCSFIWKWMHFKDAKIHSQRTHIYTQVVSLFERSV